MATLAEGKDAIREEMVKLSWAMMQQANYSGPAVSLGAAGSVNKNLSLMLQQQPTISAAVAASAMEDVHDITAAAVTSSNANAGVIITPAPRKQFPVQLNLLPPSPCPSSVQSPSKSSSAMIPQLPYTSCSSKYSFPMTWQHPAISLDRSDNAARVETVVVEAACYSSGTQALLQGAAASPLRDMIDVNQVPASMGNSCEDESPVDVQSSPGSSSGLKRERASSMQQHNMNMFDLLEQRDRPCETSSRAPGSDDEELERLAGGTSYTRKKLRLSKEQSTILEESFKEHSTLNPKQKNTLSRQLDLRPRQVEVWFQNRRARTKLKQTEVDCERLKRCCDCLALENRRLQKELHELKAVKSVASISSAPAAGRGGGTHMSQQQQLDYSSYSRPLLPAAATLTMCPSCERVSTVADNRAAHTSNNLTKPAPAPALTPHLVQSSAACS
ncbi:hypothetical protein CY35_17G044400 [Sphagnum magellanicum]|nr:hypothetical protein CY35_17G044400 [Sphagnum magellanicum]